MGTQNLRMKKLRMPCHLSSLITRRTHVGDVKMEERLNVLYKYLKMLDLEEAISNMKIIHVAGTKGKSGNL